MTNLKGLWLTYNLLALAECGLTKEDIDVSAVFNQWPGKPIEGGISGFHYNGRFDVAYGDTVTAEVTLSLGLTDSFKISKNGATFVPTVYSGELTETFYHDYSP